MAEQDPATEPEDASVSDANEETADVMTPSGADEAETVAPSEETPPSEETGRRHLSRPRRHRRSRPPHRLRPRPKRPLNRPPPRLLVRARLPPGPSQRRTTRRKVREGTVVSNGMEKTAVVVVIERVRHPRYAKTVQRTKRLYAHDETNDVRVGDRVRLVETRPLSKLKRWRVERVLERAR